jgi:hypothetical protein
MFMSVGIFFSLIVIALLAFTLIAPKNPVAKMASAVVSKNILWIGFILSGMALVSSLVYSNVIDYPPCLLCWYTRILFYPQVALFALALIKRDKKIVDYALLLTVIGLVISTYHYITESIGYSPLPCSAQGVSCLTRYVYEYGFITIPFMGLVGFTVLFLSLIISKKAYKTSVSATFQQ